MEIAESECLSFETERLETLFWSLKCFFFSQTSKTNDDLEPAQAPEVSEKESNADAPEEKSADQTTADAEEASGCAEKAHAVDGDGIASAGDAEMETDEPVLKISAVGSGGDDAGSLKISSFASGNADNVAAADDDAVQVLDGDKSKEEVSSLE